MAAVAGLAAVASAWAVTASITLFPHLSVDHDEAVYLLQADTIRHGHLFPPAPHHADAFVPWLSAQVGNHFVPKYTPVWASVIAFGHLLTGSDRAALAFIAAAVVVVTYLLGTEILGSRRLGVLAAVCMTLSPLFLIQSATFLSYLMTVLLLEGFALLLLLGLRMASGLRLAFSGALGGLALFARPFDALLVGAPFVVWLLYANRSRLRRLLWACVWLGVGAAPAVAATLAYFDAATGSPLRSPFSLTDSSDTLGFGLHRVMPEDAPTNYGPQQAWHGLLRHSVLMSFWSFGGLVLIGLGVAALIRRGRPEERLLAAVAITVPLGYVFFWGSNLQWEGPWRIGPYYYIPVLLPVTILGAKGLAQLWRWDRAIALLAVTAMAGLSTFVMVRTVQEQRQRVVDLRPLHAPLDHAHLDGALVFVPTMITDHLLTPFTESRNPTLGGRVLWALDHGGDDLDVTNEFPDRTPFVLTAENGSPPMLTQRAVARGASVSLEAIIAPQSQAVALHVTFAGRVDTYVIPRGSPSLPLTISLSSSSTTVVGPVSTHTTAPAASDATPAIAVGSIGGAGDDLGWVELDARVAGTEVEALVPTEPLVNASLSVHGA